ncbi:hypothetical protein PM3016_4323 [Paenibacillus mucilaginosus 3016]|uniref:DUF1330 domain-containing protein n=1 Tax=Paenibacillus mucilaginosus 3016 TaxID=1116391 RepID=H6NP19_9BACL|nr:DUF1330 domain-containing protein [Paenibacillus mucilaginosus]AFC31093.1 hypothetical protein PM3016_4323 [Paenibacillus mucilaginosus 3016]WFA19676.1 DUF1330 domain-containing protein [Paenibacillus mucilaginosus]
MSAYVVVDIEVLNEEVFQNYVSRVEALLKEEVPGFRNLSAERSPKGLEGPWQPSMIVIHEFPDMETASRFYYSDAYAPLIELRQSASSASVVLVAGRE